MANGAPAPGTPWWKSPLFISSLSGLIGTLAATVVGFFAYYIVSTSVAGDVDLLKTEVHVIRGELTANKRHTEEIRDEIISNINNRASEIEELFITRKNLFDRLEKFVDSLNQVHYTLSILQDRMGCLSNTVNACSSPGTSPDRVMDDISRDLTVLAEQISKDKVTINYQVDWENDEQGAVARYIREQLLKDGYHVTSIDREQVEETDIRYFYPEDRKVAEEVARHVEQILSSRGFISEIEVKDLTDYHDKNPPSALDLYVKLD